MEITSTRLLVVRPSGRLDSTHSQEFDRHLTELLGEGERRLILDMFDVEYLSSAGLRVLVMTAKKLKGVDGRMVLCSVPAHVLEILELAGFTRVLEIVATAEEAVLTLTPGDDALGELASRVRRALSLAADDAEAVGGAAKPLDRVETSPDAADGSNPVPDTAAEPGAEPGRGLRKLLGLPGRIGRGRRG